MTARTSYFMRPIALLVWAVMAASVVMGAVVLASPAWAATSTVNSTADTDDGACTSVSGGCTLREAINAANTTTGVADTINFNLGSAATITLTSGQLPPITDVAGLTIDGGSADITISGDNKYRVFEVSGAKVTLNNLTVADGGGVFAGAGIRNYHGTVTVSNSTLSGNSPGGIYSEGGTVKVSNSTLSGNSSDAGGGIYNYGGTATVSNSTLSGNSATFGGGINNTDGTLEVSNSTLSGNSVLDAVFAEGGGIYNLAGTATVSNSTLSGNSSNNRGGGIYHRTDGSNTGGTLEVSNSTLSGNSATFGGGIYNEGPATFKNTIVANSPSGGNCLGSITNGGYNLDSNTSCGFPTQNSSKDPLLGPLADNGGPTLTHALLEGSPTIDRGNSFGATTDQRGFARPQGTASDIGSFESAFTVTEDTLKPHVSTATPTGPGVARGTNLTATFSEKMDPLSITNSTFKLFKVKPDGSTTQITNVRVKLSTDGLTAKLNPFGTSSTVLGANTKYKGVITTGAKDVAGNQLDQNPTTAGLQQKGWTFTTKG